MVESVIRLYRIPTQLYLYFVQWIHKTDSCNVRRHAELKRLLQIVETI